ncbi:hypothetical protein SAMN05421857_0011, partial [Chryseobacterium formosense]|uniref:hypothetical protein n=1 Tax=Chryseobacterium formosense TaxID=236814 RepID=UPI0008E0C552
MKKIITIICMLTLQMYFAQEDFLPKIVPPSPTANALGNYGNIPVGLFTGTVNTSIPLFTYRTNNLNLPIYIFYGSNGIRVDEISSNVGLGWNLSYGGVITRTVRDRADEISTHISIPDNVTSAYSNPVTNKFLYTIGNGSDALDTEADLYSFNFNGISGKFFYDQNGLPHIVDQQAIKIERIGSTNGDGQDFLLTDSEGRKYYFTEKERTIYRISGNGHSLPSSAITAWYLSKIQHPAGDQIYFTYEPNNIAEYTGSQSQNLSMSTGYPSLQPSCQGSGYASAPIANAISNNNIEIIGKKIVSISSNMPNAGSILFDYESNSATTLDVEGNQKIRLIQQLDGTGNLIESSSFTYLNTDNKRNFLSNIFFKDPNKKFVFDYESPQNFPVRLSFRQDRWGYYNGKNNNSLIPANVKDFDLANVIYAGANKDPDPEYSKIGMLKKITYPTKGYSELKYEGNSYWGEKTIYPELVQKRLETKTDNFTDENSTQFTFTSLTNQTIVFNATLTGNSIPACNSFVSSGHFAGFVKINGGTPYHLTRDSNTRQIVVNANAGSTITIFLQANFMCSNVRVNFAYYPTAPQIFNTNLDTGGVRIMSTKDFDYQSSQIHYKRFYYAHKDDLTHSSGLKGNNPYYIDTSKWQTACEANGGLVACLFVENSKTILTSSSMTSLYDTGTMSCLYPYVTISEGGDNFEKGGEFKQFKVHKDDAGSNIWGTGGLNSNPWSNKGWDNGLELKSTLLRKNSNSGFLEIVQEKENIYEKDDSKKFELKNFAGRLLYNVICPTNYPYTCTSNDVSIPNNACSGKLAGTQVYLSNIDNVNISEYRLISYLHYLKSQITTNYLNNIPIITKKEYFYDTPSHFQLTGEKTTYPDSSIEEKAFLYAHEKGNTKLINANMIGIPLETSVIKKQNSSDPGKTISRTETKYDDPSNLFPTSVLSHDLQNASSTEITYDLYDVKGNLLQYTTKDGISTAIIWGYNSTQPIAKIVGAT